MINVKAHEEHIEAVIEHAKANVITTEFLERAMKGLIPPIGDNQNFAIMTKEFRSVFSIEQQPMGLTRHLSVSSDKKLTPDDWSSLMQAFGFRNEFDKKMFDQSNPNPSDGMAWFEDFGPKLKAFNVLETIELFEIPEGEKIEIAQAPEFKGRRENKK